MLRLIAACLLVPILALAQEGFQLPSRNIHCMAWEGALRCDILEFGYGRPPRPADCELEYGDSVQLGPRGPAELVCRGDTVAGAGLPLLGYGATWRAPGLACLAERSGLRCENGDGHGFEMARRGLRLF